MKKIYVILIIGLTLVACNDFLDVQPKGVLTEDIQFKDIQGFKDAMIGVYASIGSEKLYGGNLSYDFMDKLGQLFYNPSLPESNNISNYNFKDAEVRTKYVDVIWSEMYQTISYINNIIFHLENTNVRGSELQIMRGEAYALRAFLHYDLVRLFAQDFNINSAAKGIPYAYDFNLKNKEVFSLQGTYQNILKDLNKAEELLSDSKYEDTDKDIDIYPSYTKNRFHFINKYAVKAIKARVYYSMNDSENAKKYAQEVINNSGLALYSSGRDFGEIKKFPAQGEMIFGVKTSNSVAQHIYDTFLQKGGNYHSQTQSSTNLAKLYKTANFSAENADLRFQNYYTTGNDMAFVRYINNEQDKKTLRGLPLIRLPEMYYIVAESEYDTDQNKAIEALNEVRKSRGLLPIDKTLIDTKEKFVLEMRDERTREMVGEGQVFFALKYYHKPFSDFNGGEIIPTAETLTLPLPDSELEFGNSN